MAHAHKPATGEGAQRLIGRLVSAGVELAVDDGSIVYEGPADVLDEGALAALRENKDRVVAYLVENLARGVIALGPTTREQQRMEARLRTDRNQATYNVCLRVDLRGPIAVRRLERSVSALVTRHESLRTRFAWYGDHLLQEVMSPPGIVLERIPSSDLAGASPEEVSDWCARRGSTPFELATEIAARWCYAPIAPGRAVLLVTMHHIACDGWSIEILRRELHALYRGETPPDFAPPTITPRDFARWELGLLRSERLDAVQSFWADELRGASFAPRLERAGAGGGKGGDAARSLHVIPSDVVAHVTASARASNVTDFAVYLAGFALLVHEETNGLDCVVVIAVANRTRREHEALVGLCRNAMPIRCSVGVDPTLERVAKRMHARVLTAIEYQAYPLDVLAAKCTDCAEVRRLPFTFGYEPDEGVSVCKEADVSIDDVFCGAARADFSMLVKSHGENCEVVLEYAEQQLTAGDAALLGRRYVSILAGRTGAPHV